MPTISVFNNISLDGYFTDGSGDLSWAHRGEDPEWNAFVAGNASRGEAVLLFGRVTYEMMARFWPTPEAMRTMPVVAEGMNRHPKVVFSRTLSEATWSNTRLIKGDLLAEVRKMKQQPGPDVVIMGSGTIVSQLTGARLIDEYQLVLHPVALGGGRTLFDGIKEKLPLTLKKTRTFGNGNLVLWYECEAGA